MRHKGMVGWVVVQRKCQLCGKSYDALSRGQRYCGSYKKSTGCSVIAIRLARNLGGMRYRCGNRHGYESVAIDPAFADLDVFIQWSMRNGYSYVKELDRIDTWGPYSKENCRWVSHKQNSRNRKEHSTNWNTNERRCASCGEWKSLELFARVKKSCDGRGYYCKLCANAKSRAYYKTRRQYE